MSSYCVGLTSCYPHLGRCRVLRCDNGGDAQGKEDHAKAPPTAIAGLASALDPVISIADANVILSTVLHTYMFTRRERRVSIHLLFPWMPTASVPFTRCVKPTLFYNTHVMYACTYMRMYQPLLNNAPPNVAAKHVLHHHHSASTE